MPQVFFPTPENLKLWQIPYSKIVQRPGEFILTFPCGYHAGLNHGFNCNKAVNFSTDRWIEYGIHSTRYDCGYRGKDSVEIDMKPYIKKYHPQIFESCEKGIIVTRAPESFQFASMKKPKNVVEDNSNLIPKNDENANPSSKAEQTIIRMTPNQIIHNL